MQGVLSRRGASGGVLKRGRMRRRARLASGVSGFSASRITARTRARRPAWRRPRPSRIARVSFETLGFAKLLRMRPETRGRATALEAHGPKGLRAPKRGARSQKRRARGASDPSLRWSDPPYPTLFARSHRTRGRRHAPRAPLAFRAAPPPLPCLGPGKGRESDAAWPSSSGEAKRRPEDLAP